MLLTYPLIFHFQNSYYRYKFARDRTTKITFEILFWLRMLSRNKLIKEDAITESRNLDFLSWELETLANLSPQVPLCGLAKIWSILGPILVLLYSKIYQLSQDKNEWNFQFVNKFDEVYNQNKFESVHLSPRSLKTMSLTLIPLTYD